MEFLMEYSLQIEYIKGKENKVANALSQKRHTLSTISIYKVDLRDQILHYQGCDKFYLNKKERIRQGL